MADGGAEDDAPSIEVCAAQASGDTRFSHYAFAASSPFNSFSKKSSSSGGSFKNRSSCVRVSPKTVSAPATLQQGVRKSPRLQHDTTRLTPQLGRLLNEESKAAIWWSGARVDESAQEKPSFNRRTHCASKDPLAASTGLMHATLTGSTPSSGPISSGSSGATSLRPSGPSPEPGGRAPPSAVEAEGEAEGAATRIEVASGVQTSGVQTSGVQTSGVQTAIDFLARDLTNSSDGPSKACIASLRPDFAPSAPPRPAGVRRSANACPPTLGRLARHDAQTRQLPSVPAFGA